MVRISTNPEMPRLQKTFVTDVPVACTRYVICIDAIVAGATGPDYRFEHICGVRISFTQIHVLASVAFSAN